MSIALQVAAYAAVCTAGAVAGALGAHHRLRRTDRSAAPAGTQLLTPDQVAAARARWHTERSPVGDYAAARARWNEKQHLDLGDYAAETRGLRAQLPREPLVAGTSTAEACGAFEAFTKELGALSRHVVSPAIVRLSGGSKLSNSEIDNVIAWAMAARDNGKCGCLVATSSGPAVCLHKIDHTGPCQ